MSTEIFFQANVVDREAREQDAPVREANETATSTRPPTTNPAATMRGFVNRSSSFPTVRIPTRTPIPPAPIRFENDATPSRIDDGTRRARTPDDPLPDLVDRDRRDRAERAGCGAAAARRPRTRRRRDAAGGGGARDPRASCAASARSGSARRSTKRSASRRPRRPRPAGSARPPGTRCRRRRSRDRRRRRPPAARPCPDRGQRVRDEEVLVRTTRGTIAAAVERKKRFTDRTRSAPA